MQNTLLQDGKIDAYLERVEESNVLGRGARRPALLAYLLRSEAAGEGDRLKAYSIGLDVFDKPKDFDPTVDSSVRVEIGRLRSAIAAFEASDWADTALKVEIPVGTYRPVITKRDIETETTAPGVSADLAAQTTPTVNNRRVFGTLVAVLGLAALLFVALSTQIWRWSATASGPPIKLTVSELDGDVLGKQISLLIKDSFSNNSLVEIKTDDASRVDDGHFVVRGDVTKLSETYYVSVELTNQGNQELVWSHYFLLDKAENLPIELDTKLNGELETRLIGEAKILLERRDVATLTPEQLFILGTWVSGPAVASLEWETERVELMKLALAQDPDFGPAHSVLADKYGFLANVHPDWDTEENLNLSNYHALRAIDLSPLDSNAMFNVAQSYWHAGRHEDSQRVFRRVTELDQSNSLARFFAHLMPYWCADVPDDAMRWALDFDANLSRDDPIRWIVLTWIATLHTNRAEYDQALDAITDAAEIFQVGYTYMSHAMILAKLGQLNAAEAIIQRQQVRWPGSLATHYADSTVPRLCLEQPDAGRFIDDYMELTSALGSK